MSTPEDQNGPSQATETPEQRLERMLQAYDAAAVAPNADAGRHLREILAADVGLRRNVLKAIAENDLNAIAVEPAGGAGVRGYDVASRTLYVPAATLQAAADTDRDARKDATELVKDRVKTASLSPGDRLDRLLDDYRDAIFDPRAAPPSDRGRIDRQIDAYNLKLGEYYNTIKPPLAAADRPLLEKNDSTRAWYAGQVREHLKEVLTSDTIKATVLARIESGEVSSFTVPPEKDTAGGSYRPADGAMNVRPERLFEAGELTPPLAGGRSMNFGRSDVARNDAIGTAAHEFDHASRRAASLRASETFYKDASTVLNGSDPRDFTKPMQAFLDFQRENEARSHLEHFNAVSRSLGKNPSDRQIYDANRERMKLFFNVVEGPPKDGYPKVSLKPELQYEPPGSKQLSQGLKKNVDSMAGLYFEQKPADAGLGPKGDLDYRNNLAYPKILDLLTAADKLAAKNGTPVEVRLDLKALGLDHDLMRQYLKMPDGKPRTYIDISDPANPRRLETDKPAPVVAPANTPVNPPVNAPGNTPANTPPSPPANAPANTPANNPPASPPGRPEADRETAAPALVQRLGEKDRAMAEHVAGIAQSRGLDAAGGWNAAMAMLASVRENGLVREVDRTTAVERRDGGVTVFASYHPHGDRQPIFHASIDLARAAQVPVEESLRRIEQTDQRSLDQAKTQTQTGPEQDSSFGARTR